MEGNGQKMDPVKGRHVYCRLIGEWNSEKEEVFSERNWNPEDGGSMLVQNVAIWLLGVMTSRPQSQ
jgi:hypothetical protein